MPQSMHAWLSQKLLAARLMQAPLRIPIKDYRRNRNPKVHLVLAPFVASGLNSAKPKSSYDPNWTPRPSCRRGCGIGKRSVLGSYLLIIYLLHGVFDQCGDFGILGHPPGKPLHRSAALEYSISTLDSRELLPQ
jgi:hypothetical protein